jgi:hypothetical protein
MKEAGFFELTLELLQVDTVSRLIKLQTKVNVFLTVHHSISV